MASLTTKDINMRNGTCFLSPAVAHPDRPVIVWTAGAYLFAYNYRSCEWELKRTSYGSGQLRSVQFCPVSRQWLVAGEDKTIIILKDQSFELLCICMLETKITAACFLSGAEIAVSDKFGCVFKFSVASLMLKPKYMPESVQPEPNTMKKANSLLYRSHTQKNGDPVLGHYSIITDMIISPDKKHLVTADRDGRIRISRNPDCFVTEAFCMGHSELMYMEILVIHAISFITSVVFPSEPWNDCIVSASGDLSIRLFDIVTGKELDRLNIISILSIMECCPNFNPNLCLLPSKLYWICETREVLVIVENVAGFLRIPIRASQISEYKYTFGTAKVTQMSDIPQALVPCSLLPMLYPKKELPGTQNYNCQISHNKAIWVWWIDRFGKLQKPIFAGETQQNVALGNYEDSWNEILIGDPIPATKVSYWKTTRDYGKCVTQTQQDLNLSDSD
ncbi:putative tRna (guanine-N(7)-)-methyltransferase subunit WDR4 [Cardiosporidium cionae]|uniref:TRna (Guanine-N(7)-)-methyltransferase subunit WDR4 n=1 Tax=Cardiosporidium cionae TaxID=476202 RepID=A0ABQ7JF28_9APIC|nr:putative tRna (guanine-N(7)-)-methyltransferase subunit WDR4 [Cardiosporidium cionae]|eukprot:KAF8822638.1 putative tRna (guanine-N(7)-)-methyltransferase subunit WDR4 [Cardiosporidium cionae]